MKSFNIREGTRIGVIGGGPAGSFFSIQALKLASDLSRGVSITIFEMKDFSAKGAKGCNRCAGVITKNLLRKLDKYNITVPEDVIQTKVKGYSFRVQGRTGSVERENARIITVYRGGGPRHSDANYKKRSFDGFLLEEAISRGATLRREVVREVDFGRSSDSDVKVVYGAGKFEKFDFIVGAFGLNMGENNRVRGFSRFYRPPRKWFAFQFEVPIKTFSNRENFKDKINVFFIKPKGVKFLAVTPKGDYLTISGIGKRVIMRDLKETIMNSELLNYASENWETACLCNPAINSSFGSGIVGDRYLIIGDAACSRWLKNGIDSAFITGKFAVEALFSFGLSGFKLKWHYLTRCFLFFKLNNFFGRLMFRFHDHIMRNKVLSLSYLSLLKKEELYRSNKKRRLSSVLWNLYTGDRQYYNIFFKSLDPVLQCQLFKETIFIYINNYQEKQDAGRRT